MDGNRFRTDEPAVIQPAPGGGLTGYSCVLTVLLGIMACLIAFLMHSNSRLLSQVRASQHVQIGKPLYGHSDRVMKADQEWEATEHVIQRRSEYSTLKPPKVGGKFVEFRWLGGGYLTVSVDPDGTVVDYEWFHT